MRGGVAGTDPTENSHRKVCRNGMIVFKKVLESMHYKRPELVALVLFGVGGGSGVGSMGGVRR